MGKKQSKLQLINNIGKSYRQKYPEYPSCENKLCENCKKNNVPINFQKSNMKICRNCYEIQKEENFQSMLSDLKDRNILDDISEIIPNKLYLGNYYSATLKDSLKKRGITHILMIGYFLKEIYPKDFTYINAEIDDEEREDIFRHFYNCISNIEKGNVVYVHCQAGMSRSASIVISYVMYHFKYKYRQAHEYVLKRREIIYPNEGFIMQLKDLEKVLEYCNYNLEEFRKINEMIYKSENNDNN